MECRKMCGACCITPSITSALPGAPAGKPAGVVCPHLDQNLRCRLFGDPTRPDFCTSLQSSADMCGKNRDEALFLISVMEDATNARLAVDQRPPRRYVRDYRQASVRNRRGSCL